MQKVEQNKFNKLNKQFDPVKGYRSSCRLESNQVELGPKIIPWQFFKLRFLDCRRYIITVTMGSPPIDVTTR
ncbi:hypothetical protein ACPRNU_22725 [Chromobacterium vaccinii]|uniref:hypothetical protein n=1 Tax=Chromobacterium vaccinii TaxID=1108595 RepID=UPI003C754B4F